MTTQIKAKKAHVLLLVAVLFILINSLALSAQATTIVCNGTVDMVAYHQAGLLMVKLSSMNEPVFICSTDHEWIVPGSLAGNTSTDACKTLYSTFLLARTTGTPIKSMYMDGNAIPSACNSFAPWTNVNVRYYYY